MKKYLLLFLLLAAPVSAQPPTNTSGTTSVICVAGCGSGVPVTESGTVAGGQNSSLLIGLGYIWNGTNWIRSTGTASGTNVICVSGCAGGTTDIDDGSVASGQTTGFNIGLNYIYNGATWARLVFGQATMANSLPVTIASNQSAIPVSGFPTTVGTAVAVRCVDTTGAVFEACGGAGATGLTDTQLRATPVPVSGTFWQATQPVSGTFWQATQPVSIATMPSTPVTGTFWQATQPVSGTVAVSNFPGSQTVAGTVTSNQGTAAATTAGWPTVDGTIARTTATWSSATGLNTVLATTTTAYSSVLLTVNASAGTFATGILSLEVSDDNTIWYPVTGYLINSQFTLTTVTLTPSLSIPVLANVVSFTNYRVRLSTAITGTGTVTVALLGSTAAASTLVGTATVYQGTSPWVDNISQLNGTVVDGNSGAKSAGTLRVVLATDQPALTNKLLVTPDSVALPANQSVNVSQINAVTPLMGNGITGTGSQRVTVASDNTPFAIKIDQTTPGTTNGIRTDSSGATGGAPPARGEFETGLGSGATGGFLIGVPISDTPKVINVSTATTTLLITGVSGRQVRIGSLVVTTALANNVALIEGTGATCGTGSAGMAGGTTAASGWNFAANGGLTIGSGVGTVMQTATAGDSVCVVTSAATQLSGHIMYTIY